MNSEDAIRSLISNLGEDPEREGLLETPGRAIKAYGELCSGYKENPAHILKTFSSDGYDELVLLRDIPLYSLCEHHLLPFCGKAHVAYIPDGKIVGLSKIPRLVDAFARRLQVQERLTVQVADALHEHLNPLGTACVVEAKHLCMEMRGIKRLGGTTVTSALRGVFKDKPEARAEVMSLIRGSSE